MPPPVDPCPAGWVAPNEKVFPDVVPVGVAPVMEKDGTAGGWEEDGAEVEAPNLKLLRVSVWEPSCTGYCSPAETSHCEE